MVRGIEVCHSGSAVAQHLPLNLFFRDRWNYFPIAFLTSPTITISTPPPATLDTMEPMSSPLTAAAAATTGNGAQSHRVGSKGLLGCSVIEYE